LKKQNDKGNEIDEKKCKMDKEDNSMAGSQIDKVSTPEGVESNEAIK